jgi:hypothetical protein
LRVDPSVTVSCRSTQKHSEDLNRGGPTGVCRSTSR